MATECPWPECDKEFKKLGVHWHYNQEHRPKLNEKHHKIVVGLLMGDGHLDTHNPNPLIKVEMTSPNYLRYLNEVFGVFSTDAGVTKTRTARESATISRQTGFSKNVNANNYNAVYMWRSRSLPELKKYSHWYESGAKVWPENIELSPTTLKHWYCGDGSKSTTNKLPYISIAIENERGNEEKVTKMFTNSGLPEPSNYDTHKTSLKITFTQSDSKILWKYMGEPLPDFEYKWPDQKVYTSTYPITEYNDSTE